MGANSKVGALYSRKTQETTMHLKRSSIVAPIAEVRKSKLMRSCGTSELLIGLNRDAPGRYVS